MQVARCFIFCKCWGTDTAITYKYWDKLHRGGYWNFKGKLSERGPKTSPLWKV